MRVCTDPALSSSAKSLSAAIASAAGSNVSSDLDVLIRGRLATGCSRILAARPLEVSPSLPLLSISKDSSSARETLDEMAVMFLLCRMFDSEMDLLYLCLNSLFAGVLAKLIIRSPVMTNASNFLSPRASPTGRFEVEREDGIFSGEEEAEEVEGVGLQVSSELDPIYPR